MRVKKIKKMLEEKEISAKQIIDIRDSFELKNGKINGSKHISMNKLIAHPDRYLDKETTYYIMCQSGVRSFSTTYSLKRKKYKVKNISGGFLRWQDSM